MNNLPKGLIVRIAKQFHPAPQQDTTDTFYVWLFRSADSEKTANFQLSGRKTNGFNHITFRHDALCSFYNVSSVLISEAGLLWYVL